LLALAILGLICIGVLGVAAYFLVFRQPSNPVPVDVAVIPTPVLVASTPTPSPTFTPIPPPPTNTLEPTPTGTLVVNPNAQAAAAEQTPTVETVLGLPAVVEDESPAEQTGPTPTSTLVIQPPTPAAPAQQIPQGGGVLPANNDYYLVLAGIGVLILLIAGLVNHLRSPSSFSER
jgi:hypothetical protein